jgi:ABC-type antimicrobial peptide transport system permease subunit
MVVVAVSTAQQWTPVLDPLIPLITPLLGMVIGIISGGYPAFRASKMEPVEALRY